MRDGKPLRRATEITVLRDSTFAVSGINFRVVASISSRSCCTANLSRTIRVLRLFWTALSQLKNQRKTTAATNGKTRQINNNQQQCAPGWLGRDGERSVRIEQLNARNHGDNLSESESILVNKGLEFTADSIASL